MTDTDTQRTADAARRAGRAMGRKAFLAGLRRVPALDPEVMQFMEHTTQKHRELGRDVPSLLPFLDSWSQGWDAENLKPGAVWVERVTA
ncbi:hypothetical protein LCGC14_2431480 [marine sediment metagenome]|uniref:Uncharacterized protein n=1 Tax=marine sediment metagenome TaxID=412755 RepID=A0A0F9BLV6_9ZZZZ